MNNSCRIGAVRSGVRKPKPRRNMLLANPRPVFYPQLGTRFALLILAAFAFHTPVILAQTGVAFDVPATAFGVPMDAPPSAAGPAADGRLLVQGVSQSRRTTSRILVELDVNAVFAEPQQFQSVMFEVMPLGRQGLVVDYAPQTQATSDWSGEISSESVANKNMVLNANLNAAVPGYGTAGFLFNSTNTENTISRQSLKAPLTVVVTSGLSQRGRGAFFRFTTSRESIIEGGQKLQIVLEVPQSWRGDLMQVHCVARNKDQTIHRDFLTAVSILGDGAAQQTAESFAVADYQVDQWLRRLHITQRPKSVLEEFEQTLSRRSTNAEAIDLQRVRQSLLSATATGQVPHYNQLPQRLQTTIDEYLQTKNAMLELARPLVQGR